MSLKITSPPSTPIPDLQAGPSSKHWKVGQYLNKRVTESYLYTAGNFGSYKLFICNQSGETNIFDSWKVGYEIEIKFGFSEWFSDGLSIKSSLNDSVRFEIKIGYLDSFIVTEKISPKSKIFRYYFQPREFNLKRIKNSKKMWIRKLGGGTIMVLSSVVKEIKYTYANLYNNKLIDMNITSNGMTLPIGTPITSNIGRPAIGFVPNKALLGGNSGKEISLKFGSGVFKSGIWKTGVWNDGYRGPWNENDIQFFYFQYVNTNTYEINPNRWLLKIDSTTNPTNVKNIIDNLKVNDFISIGNVVGIDINEERFLLKDYFRINQIDIVDDYVTLTLDIPVAKFPLRRFEIDSTYHLIYVTKNIWLGGTFLNGYFKGIWNFGLFKGYPYTTIMEDSHFISGQFDGGKFRSTINSFTSSGSDTINYQSGLVQYFEFFDNNISEKDSIVGYNDNTYQSWMDLNYFTQSFVNLNSLTNIYDENFGKRISLPNLYGYPTRDVVASLSKFKNSTDETIEYYNLGIKYKVTTDHLSDNGFFTKPFSSLDKPGLSEFFNSGWVVENGNFFGTPTVSFIYTSNVNRKNFNRITMILATFGYNILNNSSILVDDKKYVMIEYNLDYFSRGQDPQSGQFTNTFQNPFSLLGSNYSSEFNQFSNNLKKTEFFYNKSALDLVLKFDSDLNFIPNFQNFIGFNYEYSTNSGETNPSFSTTYSVFIPSTSSQYLVDIDNWDENGVYSQYEIVRSADGLANFYMSLTSSNSNPITATSTFWGKLSVAYNDALTEANLLDESEIYGFFSTARINYFRFLEIDSLPFFNYFKFEVNFVSTFNSSGRLGLEFFRPHGFKEGDLVYLTLDETKSNPQYVGTHSILFVSDGLKSNGDTVYTVKLGTLYGATISGFSETGTLRKIYGDRIDQRIQTNYSSTAPKLDGLDENFIYLGNNQVILDRNQVS
jgi:hypothetical protein